MQTAAPLFPLRPTEANTVPRCAALFDLDGTLVRTFIDFAAMRREMHALSARMGTAAETDGHDDILGIVETMAATLGGSAGQAARREAFRLLEAVEAEGCAHPEPVPEATPLLHRLRDERGVAVGIITRNARRIAADLLHRMDLPYDTLIAREDTDQFKPHPTPVLQACTRLAARPADAVMTGDLWADIAAGRAAGVRATIGIRWPHDPPDRFARCAPDYEVSSLSEAATILVGLE